MRTSRGFTIIELLVVMTVIGILAGIAVPSFRNFIAQQRVKSASYEVSTSLLFARSEAIKRNAQVKVAPAAGTDWGTGWNVTINAGGTVLQNQAQTSGITITKTPAEIIFQGTGRPTAASVSNWEVAGADSTRCVRLDTAGIASTASGACP
ncbi:GspH/FimT family pseudopilin [Ramlibacter sp. WS9]|uniref:GspH/FimT family pseudopilin n=1 Tax=Ramlibacter sp. WS9 TaxID=1882741 RepID=UPI00130546B1|nr:GspH/FimT family pseudopilin [Ramlibacter sp. WS9]